ncbi:pilus assembly protein PilM [Candidatus Skiveiella danica]|uniref:pilus assembly protein PilM n=1 Tax=Candidatus Skiveiella danica TaxID=3386177 RepID=UPI0039B86396
MRQYGFTPEEAETKKRGGDLPDDHGSGVLQPFVETRRGNRSPMQFFFTSTPYNRVDYAFLAGGSAALAGLTAAVTQQTSFPCSLIDPFAEWKSAVAFVRTGCAARRPSTTACGLAVRRFFQ